MAKFAGDRLDAAHDVVEQLIVDLLVERLFVALGQRDLQQLHQGLHRRALTWGECLDMEKEQCSGEN
jgi:hypothetical protein